MYYQIVKVLCHQQKTLLFFQVCSGTELVEAQANLFNLNPTLLDRFYVLLGFFIYIFDMCVGIYQF